MTFFAAQIFSPNNKTSITVVSFFAIFLQTLAAVAFVFFYSLSCFCAELNKRDGTFDCRINFLFVCCSVRVLLKPLCDSCEWLQFVLDVTSNKRRTNVDECRRMCAHRSHWPENKIWFITFSGFVTVSVCNRIELKTEVPVLKDWFAFVTCARSFIHSLTRRSLARIRTRYKNII